MEKKSRVLQPDWDYIHNQLETNTVSAIDEVIEVMQKEDFGPDQDFVQGVGDVLGELRRLKPGTAKELFDTKFRKYPEFLHAFKESTKRILTDEELDTLRDSLVAKAIDDVDA